MKLERQLEIAVDESRLVILGSQVLFGFQRDLCFWYASPLWRRAHP